MLTIHKGQNLKVKKCINFDSVGSEFTTQFKQFPTNEQNKKKDINEEINPVV